VGNVAPNVEEEGQGSTNVDYNNLPEYLKYDFLGGSN